MGSNDLHTSTRTLARDLEPAASQIQRLIGALGMTALSGGAKELSSFADELHGWLVLADRRIGQDLEDAWTPRTADLLDSVREQIAWTIAIRRDHHVGAAAAAGLRSGSRRIRWFLEDAGLPGQTLEGPQHAFRGSPA